MDLIDRESLLRMMAHWKPYIDMGLVRSAVSHMPTIDAAPVVHGVWKRVPVEFGFGYDYECTNCGHDPGENCTRYCPNCGAKMEKQEGR